MLPFPSHYMACFGYANDWKQKGWNVVFTGQPHLRQIVENEGFCFLEIDYTVEYRVKTFKAFLGLFIRAILDKKDLKVRFKNWYYTVQSIKNTVAQHKPALIFIDDHLSYYCLYLSDCKTPIWIVNTKLSTQKSVGMPPLNSTYIPIDSLRSRLWCEVLWAVHLLKRRWKALVKHWTFAGRDEAYFQQWYAKKRHAEGMIDKQNGLYDGIKNVPKIILAPKELEFEQKKITQNETYINLKIERDETNLMTNEYLVVREKVLMLKQQPNKKVLYAAFGTLSNDNQKPLLVFLPKLIQAIAQNPDWYLVLSVGGLAMQLSEKENVMCLPFVPQLDTLTWADAMITHGGLGSVKEALQAGVPMLVYPLNTRMDMCGNGARIESKGWGLLGNMYHDTPKQITEKIRCVLKIAYLSKIKPVSCLTDRLILIMDLAESKNKFFNN